LHEYPPARIRGRNKSLYGIENCSDELRKDYMGEDGGALMG
jgi:hypothetical protein